jgi:hypothetical protein
MICDDQGGSFLWKQCVSVFKERVNFLYLRDRGGPVAGRPIIIARSRSTEIFIGGLPTEEILYIHAALLQRLCA